MLNHVADNVMYDSIPCYEGVITKVFKSQRGLGFIYQHYQRVLAKWPVAYQIKILDGVYGKTFCLQCGKSDNPPLVLLHGLAVNSTSFMANIEALSQKFCVYLLDFPGGAGRSIPKYKVMGESAVALWLQEAIQGLETRKVHLLGVSFGAWLAIKFALEQGDMLASLHLVAPPALAGKARLTFAMLWRMILIGLTLTEEKALLLCQLLAAPNYRVNKDTVKSIYLGLKYTKSYKDKGHKQDKQSCSQLKLPINIVMGEHDKLCDPDSLRPYFPHAEMAIIKGAGHLINEEQPELFSAAISNFINKLNQS